MPVDKGQVYRGTSDFRASAAWLFRREPIYKATVELTSLPRVVLFAK